MQRRLHAALRFAVLGQRETCRSVPRGGDHGVCMRSARACVRGNVSDHILRIAIVTALYVSAHVPVLCRCKSGACSSV